MKRFLNFLFPVCLLLAWQIPHGNTQVKVTGKGSGTVTRTITNAVDGKTTLEDGNSKIRVADPFYADQTLTVNSTTPTIANYSAFKTANTSSTSITTLNGISDSTYIKIVYIRIGDANTTFVHSSTFDCDGTDLVPSSGDVVRCVWTGEASPNGKWLAHKIDSYTFEDMIIESGMVYDVTHPKYGAIVGDGLCDIDEIQLAADSINANGGGTLFFPPGTYSYDSDNGAIRIYSNTTLIMWGAKFDQIKGGNRLFYTDGGSDIEFIGGEIDGNAANDGDYTEFDMGISIINAFRVTVRNMYIHNMSGDGVYLADSDDCLITECKILQTHIADSPYIGRNCVAIVEGYDNIISDNLLEGGYPAGVDLEPNASLVVANNLVSNNTVRGGSYGINMLAIAASSACDSNNVIGNIISGTNSVGIRVDRANYSSISGNTITSSGTQGIWVDSGTVYLKISNNMVYNAGNESASGSGIELTEDCRHVTISDNMVWESRRDGIKVVGTSGEECQFITVRNNTCWQNDNLDSGFDGGIRVSYADSSYIDNNFCYDHGTTITQTFGFIFGNCDVTVFGNGNRGFGNDTRLYNITTLTKEIIGQSAAYTWIVDNIAQGVGNTAMKVAGGACSEITVPFDCQIVALSIATSDTVDANEYTITIMKNGVTTGFADIINAGADVRYAYRTLLEDSDSDLLLVAGDRIQLIYNTHAALSPTGSLDVSASVLVKY